MSELYEKSLLKLELDQVLELLAGCAGSQGGKEACLRLRPSSDLEDVNLMLEQTTAASDLCTRKGNPVFGDVTDVSASLERADRGGSLQPKELLRIAGILRCARTIKGYVSEDEKQTVLDVLFRALTPNKYLEDKIFGAILSEEEIADNASAGDVGVVDLLYGGGDGGCAVLCGDIVELVGYGGLLQGYANANGKQWRVGANDAQYCIAHSLSRAPNVVCYSTSN